MKESKIFIGSEPTEEQITKLIKDFKSKYNTKGAIELTKSGFADTVITVKLKQ